MADTPMDHPFGKLTGFLTDDPKRHATRISSSEAFRVMMRSAFLSSQGVAAAGVFEKHMRAYLVSIQGGGRLEAVEAMKQPGTKVVQREENAGYAGRPAPEE